MFLKAFLVGGLICVIGQILIDTTKLTPARILVTFVVAGVILGGLEIYEPLKEWAGGGATVPITGFGYTLASQTKEMIDQEGWLGIIKGPLSAGAVGITVSVLAGLIVSLFTKSKEK